MQETHAQVLLKTEYILYIPEHLMLKRKKVKITYMDQSHISHKEYKTKRRANTESWLGFLE